MTRDDKDLDIREIYTFVWHGTACLSRHNGHRSRNEGVKAGVGDQDFLSGKFGNSLSRPGHMVDDMTKGSQLCIS